MIEFQDSKELSQITEHIISFILDGKYEMTYIVRESGGEIEDYWQSHTNTSTNANLLTNEQRIEIEAFINDYTFS
jgi:hypothetical protein